MRRAGYGVTRFGRIPSGLPSPLACCVQIVVCETISGVSLGYPPCKLLLATYNPGFEVRREFRSPQRACREAIGAGVSDSICRDVSQGDFAFFGERVFQPLILRHFWRGVGAVSPEAVWGTGQGSRRRSCAWRILGLDF